MPVRTINTQKNPSKTTGSTSPAACEYCSQGSTTLTVGANRTEDCLPCPPGTRTVALADGGGCEVGAMLSVIGSEL